MAAFTTVPSTLGSLLVGMIGGVQSPFVQQGCLLADSTAIPVGRGVLYDSANTTADINAVKLPAGAGTFFGVATINPAVLQIDGANADQYVQGQVVQVTTSCALGVMVETTEAVEPSDAVYLQHTLNSGNEPGTFRTDSDSSNAQLVDPATARWAGSYSSGKALLLLNLP